MLNPNERSVVTLVAKISPWLAPLPSGYFVARSAQAHLALPPVVAVVIGLIIELLGFASIHTWLWLMDWNIHKRKSEPAAPVSVAIILCGVYLVSTIGLTVMLEVFPSLATYSPAIFPLLAAVGAVNLTLIVQQQQREMLASQTRISKKKQGENCEKNFFQDSPLASEFSKLLSHESNDHETQKMRNMEKIIPILRENPELKMTELASLVGCSNATIYRYLHELKFRGLVSREKDQFVVHDLRNFDQ